MYVYCKWTSIRWHISTEKMSLHMIFAIVLIFSDKAKQHRTKILADITK